jgi:membrane-associated HD superfamily phosphohydrolase
MKIRAEFILLFTVIALLFACTCKSSNSIEITEQEPVAAAETTIVESTPEKAPETVVKEKEKEIEGEEEKESETAEEEFIVTEELYNKTFDDIEAIINELNEVIQKKEYEKWLKYLTEEYIEKTSKSEYLSKWFKDPDRRTLKKFFTEVVVPTRSRVKMDEIEFLDDNSVYAYIIHKEEKYLLYYLVKIEEEWKIGFY